MRVNSILVISKTPFQVLWYSNHKQIKLFIVESTVDKDVASFFGAGSSASTKPSSDFASVAAKGSGSFAFGHKTGKNYFYLCEHLSRL